MAARKKAADGQTHNNTSCAAEAVKTTAFVVLTSAGSFSSARLRGMTARCGVPVEVSAELAEYLLGTGLFKRCTAQ